MDRIADLQRFVDEHWRKDHILSRDRALLEWQHRRDEATISFLLAETNRQIDAVLGVIPTDWNYYGQRLKAHWLALWCARSDAPAGAGLQLIARAMADVQIVCVLGINARAVPLYQGLKFGLIPRVPRYVRRFGKRGEHSPNDTVEPMRPPRSQGKVVPFDDPGAWDRLWQLHLATRCISTWKDAAWLRWRYQQHPTFRYETECVTDDQGNVKACCVYRIAELEPGWRMMRIVELLGIGDAALWAAEHLCRTAEQNGCAYADFYCTNAHFAAPLVACGFRREEHVPEELPALLSPVTRGRTTLNGGVFGTTDLFESPDQLLGECLYVTRGDGDQDRPN